MHIQYRMVIPVLVATLVLGVNPLLSLAEVSSPLTSPVLASSPSPTAGLTIENTPVSEFTKQNTLLIQEQNYKDTSGETKYSLATFANPQKLSLTDWIRERNPNEYDSGESTMLGGKNGMLYKRNAEGEFAPNFYYQSNDTIFVMAGREYGADFIQFMNEKNTTPQPLSFLKDIFHVSKARAQGPYVLPFYSDQKITCGFGCYSGHTGTDYNLANRTPVAAAESGQVWNYYYAGPSNYGTMVVVRHSNGNRTRYAHLDSSLKSNDSSVSKGEQIALSGNSGGPWCQAWDSKNDCTKWASPYHLHFETRTNAGDSAYLTGTAVDPYSSNYLWSTQPPSLANQNAALKRRVRNDFNGDGTSDVFTYNKLTGWSRIDLFRNGRPYNNPWQRQMSTNLSNLIGNFNNDTDADVLQYNPVTGVATMLQSNSQGSLSVVWEVTWTSGGTEAVVGDFDGNGNDDIILYSPNSGKAQLLVSNGNLGFRQLWSTDWAKGWKLTPGDYNGDGTTDLLMYNPTTGSVRQHTFSNGVITFRWLSIWGRSWVIPSGDFNSDGRDDLLFYMPDAGRTDVAQAEADTGFTILSNRSFPTTLHTGLSLVIGNYNNSGSDDVIFYHKGTGEAIMNLFNSDSTYNELWRATWSSSLNVNN